MFSNFALLFFWALAIIFIMSSPAGERRPSAATKFPTAPSIMTINGNKHFANVGDAPSKEQYERGIQVINEEKEFKYALPS